MLSEQTTTTPPPPPPGRFRRVLRRPVTWLLVGFTALTIVYTAIQLLWIVLPEVPDASAGIVAGILIGVAVALATYYLIMRHVASRPVPELVSSRRLPDLALGVGIGVAFVGLSVLIIVVTGGYRFEVADATLTVLGPILLLALFSAVVEELVFRGVVFQAVEQMGGSGLALAVTAVLFGLSHQANPGSSLWAVIAIAIQAGLLLGALFLWRRSLWLVIGVHFGWNAFEGVLGIPVSGSDGDGLFTVTTPGPDWLTGGDFGLEGSVIPVIIGATATAWLLVSAHRSHQLHPAPRRHRRRRRTTTPTR